MNSTSVFCVVPTVGIVPENLLAYDPNPKTRFISSSNKELLLKYYCIIRPLEKQISSYLSYNEKMIFNIKFLTEANSKLNMSKEEEADFVKLILEERGILNMFHNKFYLSGFAICDSRNLNFIYHTLHRFQLRKKLACRVLQMGEYLKRNERDSWIRLLYKIFLSNFLQENFDLETVFSVFNFCGPLCVSKDHWFTCVGNFLKKFFEQPFITKILLQTSFKLMSEHVSKYYPIWILKIEEPLEKFVLMDIPVFSYILLMITIFEKLNYEKFFSKSNTEIFKKTLNNLCDLIEQKAKLTVTNNNPSQLKETRESLVKELFTFVINNCEISCSKREVSRRKVILNNFYLHVLEVLKKK